MSSSDLNPSDEDAEDFEDSGEDWTPSEEFKGKKSARRIIQRPKRRSKIKSEPKVLRSTRKSADTSASSLNGSTPKIRTEPTMKVFNIKKEESEPPKRKHSRFVEVVPIKKYKDSTSNANNDLKIGSFVIAKKDLQAGEYLTKTPAIWKIDGKTLLQKFEPMEDEEGKLFHKSTSVYTGWSPIERDQYAPISVEIFEHSNNGMIVRLDVTTLKNIPLDSD